MNFVLLIGGNGFIGSHLVDIFLENNVKVRVISRNFEKFRKPIKNVEYIIDDYGNITALKKALKGCNTIIHLAHNTDPGSSFADPYNELMENTTRFVRFLELVKKDNKRVILFSSGGVVYGNPTNKKYLVDENKRLMPISPYGVTKVTMEKYLYMYHHNYGLPYLIIRPSNAYGEREGFHGNQGAIPIFIKKLLSNEKIVIWGDGKAIRDYIYVKDLARAVFLLYQRNNINGIFNVGSGIGTDINHLLEIILSNLKAPLKKVIYTKERSVDVSKIVLNSMRIKKFIDWKPIVELDEGVKITYEWVKNQLNPKKS